MLCRLISVRMAFSIDWRGRPALSPLFVVHSGADVRTFVASLLNRRCFHRRSRQESCAAALASIQELEDRTAGAITIELHTSLLAYVHGYITRADCSICMSRCQHAIVAFWGMLLSCIEHPFRPCDSWHPLSSSCPSPGLDKKHILRKRMTRGTHDGTAGPCCCRRLG